MSKDIICEKCGNGFSSIRAMTKHINTTCKGSILAHDKDIAELKSKIVDLESQVAIMKELCVSKFAEFETAISQYESRIATTSNSHNATTSNSPHATITVNNSHNSEIVKIIKIVNIGYESVPSLTDSYVFELMKERRFNDVCRKMFDMTHFDPMFPQNMNIYAKSIDGPGFAHIKGGWRRFSNVREFIAKTKQSMATVMEEYMTRYQEKGIVTPQLNDSFVRFFQNASLEQDDELLRLIVSKSEMVEKYSLYMPMLN